jgi:hypothetical protein
MSVARPTATTEKVLETFSMAIDASPSPAAETATSPRGRRDIRAVSHFSLGISLILLGSFLWVPGLAFANERGLDRRAREDFFEREVRPILIERCSGCHGAKKQQSGLRVDSRESLIAGGETAPAIVPGDPARSLLLSAVRRDGDLQMPPDEKLTDREIELLVQWVKAGAAWPADATPSQPAVEAATDHWAFQPVRLPEVPAVGAAEAITSVDAFILAKLAEQGIAPSPPADRGTLIRRATYALTGLPPTSDEVSQFVTDSDPNAFDGIVERLLRSPHYGEHWARHWLDVARYSDTKGYVYAREERHWTHAWAYRDWVVQAFNDDMAYNRFLLLQLAADQVDDLRPGDLAAMGFLTLGRRFLGVRRDVIDDRIDVVCRGTMGLTVSCARCHDHKYDPIPTADYYSLYGVFDSCMEQQTILTDEPGDPAFRAELGKRQAALNAKMKEASAESSARARSRIGDYLFAQSELHKFPANGFDQIFQDSDLLPDFVRKWQRYLRAAKLHGDPVFATWHEYASLAEVDAGGAAVDQLQRSEADTAEAPCNPLVAAAFKTSPKSFREVCDRYVRVFAAVDSQWRAALAAAEMGNRPKPVSLDDVDAEAVRQVLYGEDSPCRVPAGPISQSETYFESARVTELWKLQGEVDRWLIEGPAVPVALALVDQAQPVDPRVFRRGNPLQLGDDVPRQFLGVLSGSSREPFHRGSGRRELARSIIDPRNPLTARVLVNRVWAHHFGAGLVTTPSDFGLRADPPSHPKLLDWLAARFVHEGWSVKQLHRWIMLSATYQQVSSVPQDKEQRDRLVKLDPDNRLLWRMNPQRLSFEELRDSLLCVTAGLNDVVGGKPIDLFKPPFPTRRTLYGLVDRQYFPGTLRMFDFANPDLHVPQRIETTVPQQALFFMNHPVVLERAIALAKVARADDNSREIVERMFRRVFQRSPSKAELIEALALVAGASERAAEEPVKTIESDEDSEQTDVPKLDAWAQLAHVLLCTNEFVFVD